MIDDVNILQKSVINGLKRASGVNIEFTLHMGAGKEPVVKRVYQGELFRELDFIKTDEFNKEYVVRFICDKDFQGNKF